MCENVVKKEGREPSLSVDVFTRRAALGLENTLRNINNEYRISMNRVQFGFNYYYYNFFLGLENTLRNINNEYRIFHEYSTVWFQILLLLLFIYFSGVRKYFEKHK